MVRARFTLESGQRFIKMMDIVKDFSPQVNLQLGENGISLSVLDASHIALISVHFFPPSFSEYQCRQNVCLGMDLLTLSKLFKTKLPEDLLLLDYSPSSPDVLRLVFEQGGFFLAFFLFSNALNITACFVQRTGFPNTRSISWISTRKGETTWTNCHLWLRGACMQRAFSTPCTISICLAKNVCSRFFFKEVFFSRTTELHYFFSS